MPNQCHYMRKGKGPIEKVNLNDWVKKRAAGYSFSNEADFNSEQTNAKTPEVAAAKTPEVADDSPPTMENTKAEIIAYLEANDYDVDENDTKAELLAAIET